MDLDRLTDNMNLRKVLREPTGMSRWIQLLFAIIAFATVTGFYTELAIQVTCPSPTPPPNSTVPPPLPPQTVKVGIQYPFGMSQPITNPCNTTQPIVLPVSGLTGSPQFFVMTGVLSVLYSFSSIVGYLMFSPYYETQPILPLIDLICTVALCLFWFIASCSFASGVSFLKHTQTFAAIQPSLCPVNKELCVELASPVWRSLNVAIIAGFTSVFCWGTGTWFIFKETTLHVPRDQFRQTIP